MTTAKKKATAPAPGEPRPCKACKEPFTPGVGGAYGEHCNRCNRAMARGETPGPRLRQPRGQAKVRVKAYVHPDMAAALTPEQLDAYAVKNLGDFLVQSAARRLRQKKWEPVQPKKRGES